MTIRRLLSLALCFVLVLVHVSPPGHSAGGEVTDDASARILSSTPCDHAIACEDCSMDGSPAPCAQCIGCLCGLMAAAPLDSNASRIPVMVAAVSVYGYLSPPEEYPPRTFPV